ncbi:hypothetical protein GCM10010112_15430 [Actinoplanes lobatus]|nr:hypothetical protein GCM10010112_15430 [Actinoplanes lobatus]
MIAYLVYSGGDRARGGFRVRPPGLTEPRMTIAVTGATAESGQPGRLGSETGTTHPR